MIGQHAMAEKRKHLAADELVPRVERTAPTIHPAVFQHTVAQADTAISITDVQGTILYVNPAFARVTGYDTAEAIGHNESLLSNKTTPPEIYKSMWQRISRGEAWGGRLVNKRKDGTRYLAELSISPVVDAGGAVVNYLGKTVIGPRLGLQFLSCLNLKSPPGFRLFGITSRIGRH